MQEVLEEYKALIKSRILRDVWRVGWFKVYDHVNIDNLKCELLFLGHSRHLKKKGILTRMQIPYLYPYGAIAILFYTPEVTLNYVEDVIHAVKNYMKNAIMITPENVKWGVDVAFVAISTIKSPSKNLIEYIEAVNPNINDQYMEELLFGKKVNKKIGIVIVDLLNKVVYGGRNIIAKEAKRLFNPNLSFIERLKSKFKH